MYFSTPSVTSSQANFVDWNKHHTNGALLKKKKEALGEIFILVIVHFYGNHSYSTQHKVNMNRLCLLLSVH